MHLEGMGWFGSAIALRLDRAGIDFTWHDTDSRVQAWRASTGLVFPAGDSRSERNRQRWLAWLDDPWWPDGLVERVSYWATHRHPPHEGKYVWADDLGTMRRSPEVGVQVDVPALVESTRERFAAQRVDGSRPATTYVIAHGFGDRLDRCVWGWSARVRLDVDQSVLDASPHRPVFYGKVVRLLTYAYAIPTAPGWWWAGSSLVNQRRPKSLDAAKHVASWLTRWQSLFGNVPVSAVTDVQEGWRPRGRNDDDGMLRVRGNVLIVPPLWHSGVRWSPDILDEVLARCGCSI